jgi:Tfp pilus assembly protein PilP
MRTWLRGLCTGLMLLAAGPMAAAASQSAPAVATPPAAPAADADGYSYDAQGRRDPFVTLVGRGVESAAQAASHGEGLQGLTVTELSLRGVILHRRGYVAIVQGADQKTHMVKPNDRLADGTVKAISPDGLTIVQEVNDPLSLVKQKEIRKTLHGSDEGK